MCDTELLIISIEKHPCLWNIGDENYHDRNMRDIAWEQVCTEIYNDWDNIEDAEKNKKYEREDVQKKAFTKWINSHLSKINEPLVDDIFTDLRDGTRLLSLLQSLTGKQYKREKGEMRVHHLNNVNKVLQVLEANGVKLINISSEAIVDGNGKLTLGLVWSVVLRWPGGRLDSLVSDHQCSSLERALLSWCQKSVANYSDVEIKNFTSSWSDGKAFLALLHRWRPNLFDYNQACLMSPIKRLELAFRLAHDRLNIDTLLDPEDVYTNNPDKKSIMMYVMCLFQSLPSEEDIKSTDNEPPDLNLETGSTTSFTGGMESRPLSLLSHASVELGGYQTALEDVLTWLLAAEDQLAQQPTKLPTDLGQLKEYFHQHEAFLLQLAGQQDGVGSVLTEGARLLAEPGLHQDEEHEIRLQMNLLNARWERLRLSALERQAAIHSALRTEQKNKLDLLRKWLTQVEGRMAEVVAAQLTQRIEKHKELQKDIEQQKESVDILANIVIIVDETDSDDEFSAMEDELTALSERWAHVCSWSQEETERLKKWCILKEKHDQEKAWLDRRESTLKSMEANPASEIAEVLNQIKKLQILKRELDDSQERLQTLQDDILLLAKQEGPLGIQSSSELQSSVESLFDRWDALNQIIEIQAHRISTFGFEISLSGSTINISQLGSSSQWELRSTGADTSSKESKKPRLGEVFTENDEHFSQIKDWLQQTELQFEHSNKSENVKPAAALTAEEHLAWYRTTLKELEEKQQLLNSVSEDKCISSKNIQEYNERLEKARNILKNRIQEYERLLHLQKDTEELNEYIVECQAFLSENRELSKCNRSELQSLLEKYEKKDEENEPLQPKVSKMNTLFNELNGQGLIDDNFKINLENVNKDWQNLKDQIKNEKTKIKNMLDNTEQLLRSLKEMCEWISNLEIEIPSSDSPIETSAQLFQLKAKYQFVRDKFDSRSADFQTIRTLANEILPNNPNQEATDLLDEITKKWNSISTQVQTRVKMLQNASNHYGQFRSLAAQQADWLDRLERRLARASPTAVDAEDISEELDDLENYISSEAEDRVQQLKHAAKELQNSGVMVDAIQADLLAVTNRWDRLREQATERAAMLERSVDEAQQSETKILQFQAWLDRTDSMLSARVDNDLTADDLPDDDQILSQEFESQEQILNEMIDQVNVFRENGKHEAAVRLKEQVDSLQIRFENVQRTYERFRRTDCVEARLSRATRQLRDVSDASCLLEPASADIEGIEGQLKHCLKFYRTLSEIKGEVTDVIKLGRKLVEERAVPDPQQLTARVDALKELYNTLGAQITNAKQTLEKALELLRGIHDRISDLLEWLNYNEDTCDWNLLAEIKPSLKILLEDYDEFSKMCDPVYSHSLKENINDIKARWEKLESHMQLAKWLDDKEAEAECASETKLLELEKELMFKKPLFEKCPKILHQKWKDLIEQVKDHNLEQREANEVESVTKNDQTNPEPMSQDESDSSNIESHDIENDSSDTFKLLEKNSLFSQISNMDVKKIDEYQKVDDERCQVVEVKETEPSQTFIASIEIFPRTTLPSPEHAVEMVEIFESESIESIPDETAKSNTNKVIEDIRNKSQLHDISDRMITTSIQELESSRQVAVVSVSHKPSTTPVSSLPPLSPLLPSADIIEFERQAKIMLDRMEAMRSAIKAVSIETDPSRRLEILKTELSLLAPDAATLISRGDSLVLMLHTSQPKRAERLRSDTIAKLRSGWASVREECESQRQKALIAQNLYEEYRALLNSLRDWLDVVPGRITLANNHEGQLQKLKEEFDVKNFEIERLKNIANELKKSNVEIFDGELNNIKLKWQQVTKQLQVLCTSPKNKDKFATDQELKVVPFTLEKDSALYRFGTQLDALISWVMETKTRLNIAKDLSTNERERIQQNITTSVQDREMEVKEIFENFTNLEGSASTPLAVEFQEKIKKLREDWNYIRKKDIFKDVAELKSDSAQASSPKSVTTATTTSTTTSTTSTSSASTSRSSSSPSSRISTTQGRSSVTPTKQSIQSLAAAAATEAASASSAVIASFDKSILQIRDWLTVEEEMLRQQTVVVSNVEEIAQLIDKQKSVLRELEQKKPQLDELVHTAENLKADSNRQQLHGKVTKLREHWDETNSKVMQRKAQLDAMLNDSQRYEGKRLEVEAWLARMEVRLQRMAPAGHTADVLEAQLREQKSFHAELHQYKHHIELFNQLTQKLIAVYQQDDTTRVKKMTEQINLRYNSLNTSIINRGKLLNSAMNSLHNFDRSLDKFLAWLSEAESSLESMEVDAERAVTVSTVGSRHQDVMNSLPHHQLKICKMRPTTFCESIVKSILYPKFNGSGVTRWGQEKESIAIQNFELEKLIKVEPAGLFLHPDFPYLGASPDGLIHDDGIIEIKCPFNAANLTPEETIKNKKRDQVFYDTKMKNRLIKFCNECLLLELVNAGYRRNLPI